MRRLASCLLTATLALPTFADIQFRNWDDPDAEPWRETEYALPPYPKPENLIEFYVSAASTAKFYIDQTSISPGGKDSVVRYVLVVKTSGGATNISYEGLRCDQPQLKIYATGRPDGTWYPNPRPEWRPLKNQTLNLHQGQLARNYFCPNFVPIFTAEEGRNALKRGIHPDVPGESSR